MANSPLDLCIEDAQHAIEVHKKLAGPSVPENPLVRLIADTPDNQTNETRRQVLARMRFAQIIGLRRFNYRQSL